MKYMKGEVKMYIKEKFSPRLDLTNHLFREDERHA